MKVIPGFNVSGFIFAAAFFAGLGFGTSAFAQAKHSYLIDLNSKTATDIGTLGGTGIQDYTYASGINDVGQVVGYSPAYSPSGPGFSDDHAFITGPNGKGMTDLSLGGLRKFRYWHQCCRASGVECRFDYLPAAIHLDGTCFYHQPYG